jgi:hypothetical protein
MKGGEGIKFERWFSSSLGNRMQHFPGKIGKDAMARCGWMDAVPEEIALRFEAVVGCYIRHDAGIGDIGQMVSLRISHYLVQPVVKVEFS